MKFAIGLALLALLAGSATATVHFKETFDSECSLRATAVGPRKFEDLGDQTLTDRLNFGLPRRDLGVPVEEVQLEGG